MYTTDKVLSITGLGKFTQRLCTRCVRSKFNNLMWWQDVLTLTVHDTDTGTPCEMCGYVAHPPEHVEENEHMRLELTGNPLDPVVVTPPKGIFTRAIDKLKRMGS